MAADTIWDATPGTRVIPPSRAGRKARHLHYPLESDMRAFSNAMTVKQFEQRRRRGVFLQVHGVGRFRNLNVSFDDVTRRYKTQLAMVYCDVVESSLVGNQKHAPVTRTHVERFGRTTSIRGTPALPVVEREE